MRHAQPTSRRAAANNFAKPLRARAAPVCREPALEQGPLGSRAHAVAVAGSPAYGFKPGV
jgi:hypothetical protein